MYLHPPSKFKIYNMTSWEGLSHEYRHCFCISYVICGPGYNIHSSSIFLIKRFPTHSSNVLLENNFPCFNIFFVIWPSINLKMTVIFVTANKVPIVLMQRKLVKCYEWNIQKGEGDLTLNLRMYYNFHIGGPAVSTSFSDPPRRVLQLFRPIQFKFSSILALKHNDII